MPKRRRRSPEQIIEDLRKKIEDLERRKKAKEFSKDPSLKAMRLARMHLRKACKLLKSSGPFSQEFIREANSFLGSMDRNLEALGARRPKGGGAAGGRRRRTA